MTNVGAAGEAGAPEPDKRKCVHRGSLFTPGIEAGCIECAIELGRQIAFCELGFTVEHEEAMRQVRAVLARAETETPKGNEGPWKTRIEYIDHCVGVFDDFYADGMDERTALRAAIEVASCWSDPPMSASEASQLLDAGASGGPDLPRVDKDGCYTLPDGTCAGCPHCPHRAGGGQEQPKLSQFPARLAELRRCTSLEGADLDDLWAAIDTLASPAGEERPSGPWREDHRFADDVTITDGAGRFIHVAPWEAAPVIDALNRSRVAAGTEGGQ